MSELESLSSRIDGEFAAVEKEFKDMQPAKTTPPHLAVHIPHGSSCNPAA